MTRATEAGFTLIETLVALVVLSLSAMAILGAAEAHVARIGALEARAAAQWAAQNHLAEITLGLAPDPRPAAILGIDFQLDMQTTLTSDPDLLRLDIVASEVDGGRTMARLTGFVARTSTEAAP